MPANCNGAGPLGYVVSTWPRLSQTFVLGEVLGLEERGFQVRIFSVKEPGGEPVHAEVRRVRAAVSYLAFRGRRLPVLRANLRFMRRRPGRYLRTLLRSVRYRRMGVLRHFFRAAYLAGLLAENPVAHLHAHFATAPALVAMFTSALTGIPYTFTAHARDIYVDTRPELLRAQMERANAVVTVSEYNRKHLLNRFNGAASGRVVCIHNGIDIEQFPFRPPAERNNSVPTILSVARLVEKKGLADLIEAAAVLRRKGLVFQVRIIGAGPLLEPLKARAAETGMADMIAFQGAQPLEVVRAAYRDAAVFVLPCIVSADGDRDGIPTALLEAMLSGVPVVSTSVSGIPEVIETEEAGLLVAPGNPLLLALAIQRLLQDQVLRGRLAQSARQRVESEFSIDLSLSRLTTLFSAGGRA